MSYKLSHTAEEVDELLGKVKGGVCLPVVELSTTIASGATFTAEESAAFTAAYESGLPIAIRCNIQMSSLLFENCAVLAMATTSSGIRCIAWYLAGITVQLLFLNEVWMVNDCG